MYTWNDNYVFICQVSGGTGAPNSNVPGGGMQPPTQQQPPTQHFQHYPPQHAVSCSYSDRYHLDYCDNDKRAVMMEMLCVLLWNRTGGFKTFAHW